MEVINSFFSNIKDKLTNPYFGTLILVLLLHHWELIFGIINFDEEYTLPQKLFFVESYINNNITWKSFLWDIIQAFLYMFLGYLIIIFTRSMVLWIEYWLMPSITGKIINKNVVQKTDYDNVVKEREQYFDLYEEQRKNVREFSKTIDEQTEQIKSKDKNLLEQTTLISETIKELDIIKKELYSSTEMNKEKDNRIKKLSEKIDAITNENNIYVEHLRGYESLFFHSMNHEFFSSKDNFPPEIINKVKELKRDNKWDTFLNFGNYLRKGGSIGENTVKSMFSRGLAVSEETRDGLTPIGKIIYHYNYAFTNSFNEQPLLSSNKGFPR